MRFEALASRQARDLRREAPVLSYLTIRCDRTCFLLTIRVIVGVVYETVVGYLNFNP